jgi:hypothetical protein
MIYFIPYILTSLILFILLLYKNKQDKPDFKISRDLDLDTWFNCVRYDK